MHKEVGEPDWDMVAFVFIERRTDLAPDRHVRSGTTLDDPPIVAGKLAQDHLWSWPIYVSEHLDVPFNENEGFSEDR